jgi:hypothetical protein
LGLDGDLGPGHDVEEVEDDVLDVVLVAYVQA